MLVDLNFTNQVKMVKFMKFEFLEKFALCCILCKIYYCRVFLPKQVIRYIRPFRCDNTLGFCCLQELEVQCPPGKTIGWVKQNCSFLSPRFSVLDDTGHVVYTIKGPCFSCKWCDVEFQVFLYKCI